MSAKLYNFGFNISLNLISNERYKENKGIDLKFIKFAKKAKN